MSGATDIATWPAPSIRVEPRRLAPGGTGQIVVTLAIPDGCHVQSHTPKEPFLIPTAVELIGSDGLDVGAASYPAGHTERFEWTPVELDIYRGTVEIVVPVTASATSGTATVTGRLRFQGCTESACLPPTEHPIHARVEVTARPDGWVAGLRVADLGHDVAEHGMAAIEDVLPSFVAHARARGVASLLLDLLADAGEPEVARQRAFGLVLVELEREPCDGRDAGTYVAA